MQFNQTKFHYFLLLCGLLILGACAPESGENSLQTEETSAEVIAALFDQWNESLQTGQPEAVVSHYAPHAVLLPTVSNQVRTNHDEIRDYFEHFLALSPYGTINEQYIRIFGNIAINSGIYTFDVVKDGEARQVQARYTFVYEKTGDQWLIVDHHSSAMPEG